MKALVYVVDDELLLAQIMEAILQCAGYDVQSFVDPVRALEAFNNAQEKPALLITDYVMQPFNGLELINRCRTAHPAIRTIVVSGNVGAGLLAADGSGPDAFLAKPFLPSMFIEEVNSVLQNPANQAHE